MSESKRFVKAELKALPKALRKGLRILPTSAGAKPVSKKIKSYVKRAVRQTEELKCAPALTIADQQPVLGTGLDKSGSNLGYTYTSSLIPPVAQGTGDGQRIGNKISPKKLVLRYSVRALPVTAVGGTNPKPALPFLCRVIVYRHRYATDDYGNGGLLNIGGSSQNLGSTPDLWLEPYNKDEFIIAYSKTFMMQTVTNNSGASTVSDNAANGTKHFVMGKATIPLPKSLHYNDNVTIPTNAGWYFAVACCNTDGTSDAITIFRAQVNAESYMYFTDA